MIKSKKLQAYIMRSYVSFTIKILLSLFVLILVILILTGMITSGASVDKLSAENVVRADYRNIDTSQIEAIGGSLEILDKDLKLVYRKGTIIEDIKQYDFAKLLSYTNLVNFDSKILTFGTWNVELDSSKTKEEIKQYATYAVFKGTDGEEYLCVVKVPREHIIGNYTINSDNNREKMVSLIMNSTIFIGFILIFGIMIYIYSKRINKKIDKPVSTITEGLARITAGDYSVRLDFETENEFVQMRDSFNYMAERMEQTEEREKTFDQERQQLFSNIAHDLKTPITTINGYTKALMDGLVKTDMKKQEYYDVIHQKAIRMDELIDLLFVYSKLDNSSYSLKLESIDVAIFVRGILAEHYSAIEEYDTELEVDVMEEPVYCKIDKLEMGRAITNLLMNVMKHNKRGTKLFVCIQKLEDKVVQLDIADNGIAIPDEIKDRIFEPFVSGDESRLSKRGSGLGLSISKKIVEKHGGELKLLDKYEGYVKCFRITLQQEQKLREYI